GGLAVAPAQPAATPAPPAATPAPTAVVAAPTAAPAPPQEPTAVAAPADIPQVEWFALRPEVAAHWALALDPRNDAMFTLSPRNRAEFDGADKRILALFFKQSPAFDTALNTILEVFGSKRIPVAFTALNFKGSDDLGRQALDYAVAQHFDLIFSMGSDAT